MKINRHRGTKQPGYIKKSYELPEYPGRVKANNEINEEKERQKELERLERVKEYKTTYNKDWK